jgi:hypothetical protein
MVARDRLVVECVEAKVRETIERTEHLVALVPQELLDWRPPVPSGAPTGTDLGHLLGHLPDCLAGFCAAFYAAFPSELSELLALRSIAVNESCSPQKAAVCIRQFATAIERGFHLCEDTDLSRLIPTAFVPEGEKLLTLLLGNLEHLTNHKYQLFFYLKLMGRPVGTQDLYHLRGPADATR